MPFPSTLWRTLLVLALALPLRAQNPALAAADMDFTRDIVKRFHYAAWVSLEVQDGVYQKFQYDHYPATGPGTEIERVKADAGVFVRKPGSAWMKSDDWGETGTPVSQDISDELDTDVKVVQAQFEKPVHHDLSQGGTVWRFISQSKDKDLTLYTYEMTREHPHPEGVYPRLTFEKAAHDQDGRLFLCGATAQLVGDDSRRIPCSVRLIYLIPIPAGSTIDVYDKDTGKKKYHEAAGDHSGWEVMSMQSEPPAGP